MKIRITIVLTLTQLFVLAQSTTDWDRDVIKKNKIEQISIYIKVPTTNPAHPLRLTKQFSFDKKGRVSKSLCKDCVSQTHRADGRFSEDVSEKFFYKDNKFLKIERTEFEESTDHFYYNKSRGKRLKITLDKSEERIALELCHLDKEGREILTYSVDFESPYPDGDSVSQIFITKSTAKYELNKVTRQEYISNELVNMGRRIHISTFKVFNSSIMPTEIENSLNALDQSFLEPYRKEITEITAQKIQIIDGEINKVKATYTKDKNGLIIQGMEKKWDWMDELVYEYKYRN
jgi:hypothetical protein